MRVVTGQLAGLQYKSPKTSSTHPMSEKARAALFQILGDINGLTVLDAYSGSGALSIEAYSLGASSLIAIDNNKNAIDTININLKLLNIENHIKVINISIEKWLNMRKDSFDLVLVDPPYNQINHKTVINLSTRVKEHGLFVLSWPLNIDKPQFNNLDLLKHKKYGDCQLFFYRG